MCVWGGGGGGGGRFDQTKYRSLFCDVIDLKIIYKAT